MAAVAALRWRRCGARTQVVDRVDLEDVDVVHLGQQLLQLPFAHAGRYPEDKFVVFFLLGTAAAAQTVRRTRDNAHFGSLQLRPPSTRPLPLSPKQSTPSRARRLTISVVRKRDNVTMGVGNSTR